MLESSSSVQLCMSSSNKRTYVRTISRFNADIQLKMYKCLICLLFYAYSCTMCVYEGVAICGVSGKSKIDLHIPCTDIIHINASKGNASL